MQFCELGTASYHEDASVIDSDSEVTVWSMTSTSNLRFRL